MVSLFQLAANETTAGSVFYLGSIFGPVGTVLGGPGSGLFGVMFGVFNTAVLALGVIIISYTTFLSILLTAQEGEFLGKRFHSLWVPLRTVVGISALVPTASGYSYLQIGMMWFIIQGIGAADTLWQKTVEYIASGAPIAPTSPEDAATSTIAVEMQLGMLFQGLTCQAAAKAKYAPGYYCYDHPGDAFCVQSDSSMLTPTTANTAQVSNGKYNMGPGGACGALTLGGSDPIGTAQNNAFQSIVPTLGAIAKQFVDIEYAYRSYYNQAHATPAPTPMPTPPDWLQQFCSSQNPPPTPCSGSSPDSQNIVTSLYWPYSLQPDFGNFFPPTATAYSAVMRTAATNQANSNNNSPSNPGGWYASAIANGWIFAGGFFYNIAAVNNAVSSAVTSIRVVAGVPSGAGDVARAMSQEATALVKEIAGKEAVSGSLLGGDVSCGDDTYGGGGNALCGQIMHSWMRNLSSSGGTTLSSNPLISAQKFGHSVLDAITIIVPTMIILNAALGLAGASVLGTDPLFMSIMLGFQTALPAIMFLVLMFLGVGVTMGVYTPMVPYMLFTFGAIGWLTATIETMVAAPIVAIGFLYPEGAHEIWGKAEKAIMLILNIFLRPSLMIFGLIGGMFMSYVVIMMINFAFMNVMNMVTRSEANILELIFFMVLYTSFFTTALNKCFDLIHLIPDKVLRWIGEGGEQFGESQSIEKIGGAVSGASDKAGSAMSSAASGAGELGGASDKGDQAASKNAEGRQYAADYKAKKQGASATSGTEPGGGGGGGSASVGGAPASGGNNPPAAGGEQKGGGGGSPPAAGGT